MNEPGTMSCKYDAFISYRHREPDSSAARTLLLDLEADGYIIAIDERDFDASASFLAEMERCVRESRFTLALVSSEYFNSGNTEQEAVICKVLDMSERKRRLVPLFTERINVPVWMYGIVGIDLTAQNALISPLQKLRKTLGTPITRESARDERLQRSLWNAPERKLSFTGRDPLLRQIHESLLQFRTIALTGLGGIGKTATATEYAHRSRDKFTAVFWTSADSAAVLSSGCVEIARLLDIPEHDLHPKNAIAAVQRWLANNERWLLILDNVEEQQLIHSFLSLGCGYILMTTQVAAPIGGVRKVHLREMPPEEGALMLLRGAQRLNENSGLEDADVMEAQVARSISAELNGLPLALGQAAAFIQEMFSSPTEYLALYKEEGRRMRDWRAELFEASHSSVTITLSLAFAKVAADSAAAADLLRVCAFLAPDAIPEEIIVLGACELGEHLRATGGDALLRTRAIATACRFSLLSRNPENKMLTIHRLVQKVLVDEMDSETQRLWVERVVRALNRAFTERDSFQSWHACSRLIPHIQTCTKLIDEWRIGFSEAGHLLDKAGVYLWERAQYTEAEQFLITALALRQKQSGPEHSDLGRTMHHLADVYREEGRFHDAEQLYFREQNIWERSEHPAHRLDMTRCLHGLALLFRDWGRYGEAEEIFNRAITLREELLGADDLNVAWLWGDLAQLHCRQKHYVPAARLLEKALKIVRNVAGKEHPLLGLFLRELAACCSTEQPEEAERLLLEALEIQKTVYGPDHLHVVRTLYSFASLYQRSNRAVDAEAYYFQALSILDKTLSGGHPDHALVLHAFALFYHEQGRFADAEPLYAKALMMRRQLFGSNHSEFHSTLNDLCRLLRDTGRSEEALKLEG
jgi:tetratricopeptide (TPR) repeat protein